MNYSFCVYLDKPQRVDMYLSTLFQDFSRSFIQKIIDKGQVKVNGNEIKKNIKIKNKEEIEINIVIGKAKVDAEEIDLDIVYEDENLIIVNKDAGINTHPVPGEEGKTGTLVNALLYHTKNLATIGGEERPGIVHRLDKDTSGLIMIAKNDKMMKYLQDIIQKREVDKFYIAIVAGVFKDKQFKIESYIGRHPTDKIKMTTKNPINPKIAITHGEVLGYIYDNIGMIPPFVKGGRGFLDNENSPKYTILKIKLETGRTHQIRVHLSSIGFPIIGDKVYGNADINKEVMKEYGLERQALHSYKLGFELYGKRVEFVGELKYDMKKIINFSI